MLKMRQQIRLNQNERKRYQIPVYKVNATYVISDKRLQLMVNTTTRKKSGRSNTLQSF